MWWTGSSVEERSEARARLQAGGRGDNRIPSRITIRWRTNAGLPGDRRIGTVGRPEPRFWPGYLPDGERSGHLRETLHRAEVDGAASRQGAVPTRHRLEAREKGGKCNHDVNLPCPYALCVSRAKERRDIDGTSAGLIEQSA